MSSMNREQLGEWLSAYLDKELSAEESRRIEAILETDEEARRTLEELRRTASLVAALPSHGAPESVAENIRAQVERQALLGDSPTEAAPQRRRSPLRAVLSLAAVLAVIVSGLMYITLGQPLGGGRPSGDQVAMRTADSVEAEAGVAGDAIPSTPSIAEESPLLASASFEQKLAAGMPLSSVRRHAFDNEPVRLEVAVDDAAELDDVTTRVVSFLQSRHAADLEHVASAVSPDKTGRIVARSRSKSRSKPDPGETIAPLRDAAESASSGALTRALFYRGVPGQNFADANERQILVRAPREELEAMLATIGGPEKVARRVALRSGPVTVRGYARASAALRGISGGARDTGRPVEDKDALAAADKPDDPSGVDTPPTGGRGLLEVLSQITGIDPEVGRSLAKTEKPAEEGRPEEPGPVAGTDESREDHATDSATGSKGVASTGLKAAPASAADTDRVPGRKEVDALADGGGADLATSDAGDSDRSALLSPKNAPAGEGAARVTRRRAARSRTQPRNRPATPGPGEAAERDRAIDAAHAASNGKKLKSERPELAARTVDGAGPNTDATGLAPSAGQTKGMPSLVERRLAALKRSKRKGRTGAGGAQRHLAVDSRNPTAGGRAASPGDVAEGAPSSFVTLVIAVKLAPTRRPKTAPPAGSRTGRQPVGDTNAAANKNKRQK